MRFKNILSKKLIIILSFLFILYTRGLYTIVVIYTYISSSNLYIIYHVFNQIIMMNKINNNIN